MALHCVRVFGYHGIVFLREPAFGMWSASVGVGIHVGDAVIRPEVGVLGDGNGDEFMFQIGIGVEFISRKRADDDADSDRSSYGGRQDR